MTTSAKKSIKTVLNVLLWIFLIFSICMTVLAFAANASGFGYPKLGNTCFFTVLTDSMVGENGFNPGDLIICTVPEDANHLEKDTVISFLSDLDGDGVDEINTHRIVSADTSTDTTVYTTKGDHYEANDIKKVSSDKVIAVWNGTKIAGVGSIINYVQSRTGFFLCVVLPMAAIFVAQLFVLIDTVRDIKGKKNAATFSKEEEEAIKAAAIAEFLAKQKAEEEANKFEK